MKRALSRSMLALGVLGVWMPPAHAQDKRACVAASESSQKLRKQKKLRAARKELVACAQEACPAVIKRDCAAWLAEVDSSIPSVVLSMKDPAGNDAEDVRIFLDDEALGPLDGSAIQLDPGRHTFRFEPETGEVVEAKLMILEGEKKRVVSAVVGERRAAPTAEAPREIAPEGPRTSGSAKGAEAPKAAPIPTSAWILGGIAAASFASFAYFGVTGVADRDRLRETCAPACIPSDQDPVKRKLLLADISLGAGIVSLGVATVLLLNRDAEPSASARVTFDATPVAGGALGTIGGSF